MLTTAQYLLRFDDICPTMKWDTWFRIEELLVKHDAKPILAVVPDNVDPVLMVDPPRDDFWDHVRRWRDLGWTIALHGYQHRYVTEDAGLMGINQYSEFSGLPLAIQREKIRAGVDIFAREGVRPDTWVAPAHSFDHHTLTALKENGITIVSDGFATRPYTTDDGMTWVPQQIWGYRPLGRGVWTICYHHNAWDDAKLQTLAATLRSIEGRQTTVNEAVERYARPYSVRDRVFDSVWRMALWSKLRVARGAARRLCGQN
jgi:predicted deacetylase